MNPKLHINWRFVWLLERGSPCEYVDRCAPWQFIATSDPFKAYRWDTKAMAEEHLRIAKLGHITDVSQEELNRWKPVEHGFTQ